MNTTMNQDCAPAPQPLLYQFVQSIEAHLEGTYNDLIAIHGSVQNIESLPCEPSSDKAAENPKPYDLATALDRLVSLAGRNRSAADSIKDRLRKLV